MTTKEFEQMLKLVTPEVYHLQAPTGVNEYVVWHGYGHNGIVGDDGVRLELLKVQLDVLWQDLESTFLESIKETLSTFDIAYFEAEYGYDEDWNAMRCILQLEID